jgi:GxxExxY protein
MTLVPKIDHGGHGGTQRKIEGAMEIEAINDRTGQIVDAAMRVHSALGPGLLEAAYEACLVYELRKRGLHICTQVALPVIYDRVRIDIGYRVDLLVDDTVLVELKAVTKILPLHEAQLLSYLKLSRHRVGLLINFHVVRLRDGIKRMIIDL